MQADNPYTINTPSGVIDLTTGDFASKDHPEDALTADIEYSAREECPGWEAFLERSVGADTAALVRLRSAIGYTFTGSTKLRSMFLCHSGKGKTTLLTVLSCLLADYATTIRSDALSPRAEPLNEVERAALVGRRLVYLDSDATGARTWKRPEICSARIKDMVDAEVIDARRVFQAAPFVFPTRFKVWALARHQPVLADDPWLYRRLNLIPFREVESQDMEEGLAKRLLAEEAHGIFAWCIRAAIEWTSQ